MLALSSKSLLFVLETQQNKEARAKCVIYSLVETAGANGLSERGYLHIVLPNLPSMDFPPAS